MTTIRRGWRPKPADVLTVIVTAVVLGPLLVGRGFALRGDMVFTPDQPWKSAGLGLNGAVPRAVPMDALISILDEVIPGAVLQRLLLVLALVLAGTGIARLCRTFGPIAQCAAVVVFLWNPWVYERLAIGQWAMVLAYGLLPWTVLAALRLRDGLAGGWPATMVALCLLAASAPSFGVAGALVVAVVMLGAPTRQRLAGVLGMSIVANLPWAVPALLGPTLDGDAAQFDGFAARGESSLGTFISLLSMGGIWKTSIVPPERGQSIVIGIAALVALAFLVGLRYAAPILGKQTTTALVVLGVGALLMALLPTFAPVGDLLGDVSNRWSAVGILRDSHRYLAPFGLLLAVGAAGLVERIVAAGRPGRFGVAGSAFFALLAPVVLLPSMVWGLAGGLSPATYPADWENVESTITSAKGARGAVVSLPWRGAYRGYAWNDRRAVLDPSDRILASDVLNDDRIFLTDRVLPGEDPYLAKVGAALEDSDPAGALGGLGVRWALVAKEHGVGGDDVPAGVTVYDGRWLTLVDLGPPDRAVDEVRNTAPPGWVYAADFVVLLGICVSFWHLWRLMMWNRSLSV